MTLKKLSLFGLTALAILTLVACDLDDDKDEVAVQQSTTQQTSQSVSETTGQAGTYTPAISQEDAVKRALEAAGLKQEEVINLTVEQDFDDMPYSYEIEFVKDTIEYSYSIDADSGNVLEQSQENVND
ncbi:PepSY domain-containing protein [Streptococcus sp. S784/96/1]|uniref:PepSY domain-containing protein n=1 Tax=Streptococcus sp. S784/96/1 TaxID=2653499 RepID=UPI00138723DA|nr:PepSY domain-containing protein [Streptococcus sp. S784/96/1]